MTDPTEKQNEANAIAPEVLRTAATYAEAALEAYRRMYPEQAEIAAASGDAFDVRIKGLASTTPRVVLVRVIDRREASNCVFSQEVELAWTDLQSRMPALSRPTH